MRKVRWIVVLFFVLVACQTDSELATDTPDLAEVISMVATPAPPTMPGEWVAFYTLGEPLAVGCQGMQVAVMDVGVTEPQAMIEAVAQDRQARQAMAKGLEPAVAVGAVRIQVENTTDNPYFVYPNEGWVIVGTEQVGLTTYVFMSDDLGGELAAGQRKEGVLRFGLNNTPPDEVDNLYLIIPSPANQQLDDLCQDDLEARLTLQP